MQHSGEVKTHHSRMSQLVQMTRHVTTWLGWTPATPCDCQTSEEDALQFQESSGFATVLVLYLGMAGLFAGLDLCTTPNPGQARARDKRELAALERRQAQRLGGQRDRSTAGSWLPCWLVNLPSLIRQVAAPRPPNIQRQQKKQTLELELQGKWLGLKEEPPTWHDAIEEEELGLVAPSTLMPQRQVSTFFDLPSESE
ncbi:uncharacterized protein LOC128264478 isoform X2 [Drosophila gunungcola]|uniref:Uncharacterized protein n=1 Tax=Drosophila gunungcola TaxID=103775 RepID=A0A9P9YD21_9MUSC|nr:uncharacterized protein LOC128264478 isoform X2 [Drosophila gunungcola]KAI8034485.1 hypothetical protein M5D96_012759 [Drosophila gunungcola]